MIYNLRPFCGEDIDIVLEWRNSERIRKNMYYDKVISSDEHRKWFSGILENETEKYLMFLIQNKPAGIVCFNKISSTHKHCFWGFYIGNPNVPKGSGSVLGVLGLDYAFMTYSLLKINGEVLSINRESINFHEKLGFVKEGLFEKHINKNGKFENVIRYALFQSNWEVQRQTIFSDLEKKGIKIESSNYK